MIPHTLNDDICVVVDPRGQSTCRQASVRGSSNLRECASAVCESASKLLSIKQSESIIQVGKLRVDESARKRLSASQSGVMMCVGKSISGAKEWSLNYSVASMTVLFC